MVKTDKYLNSKKGDKKYNNVGKTDTQVIKPNSKSKPSSNGFLSQFVKSKDIIGGYDEQADDNYNLSKNQRKVDKEIKIKTQRKSSVNSHKSDKKEKIADKPDKVKLTKDNNKKTKKASSELSDVDNDLQIETMFSKRETHNPRSNSENQVDDSNNIGNKKIKTDSAVETKPVTPNKSLKKLKNKKLDNEEKPVYETYISALPTEATAETVYQHFKNCGRIVDVKLQFASDGTPKKKGFIKFDTIQGRDNALKLNKSIMINKRINVEKVFDTLTKKPEGEFIPPKNPNSKEGRSIIVRNLPFSFNEDDMYKMFVSCGEIVKHRVIRNEKGQSRGFGFVDFIDNESSSEAVKKNGTKVEGRPIYIEFTAPKEYPETENNEGEPRAYNNRTHRVNDNRYINENRKGFMAKNFTGEIVDL